MATESRRTAANDPGHGRVGPWFGQVHSFVERYARELFRNRVVLFWSVGFPVGFYLLTVTVFLPTDEIPEAALPAVKALTAVGYGSFGAVVASLNSFGQQLVDDVEADRYVQFRSLPVAPSADLAGRICSAMGLAAVSFLAVLAAALATGADLALREPASLLVVTVAFATFAVVHMVVAVGIAAVVQDPRYASVITVTLAMLSYFLTGYNGTSPGQFSGPDVLLNVLPNALATRLIADNVVPAHSGQLSPPAVPSVPVGLAALSAMAAVALAVGVAVIRRSFYHRGVIA